MYEEKISEFLSIIKDYPFIQGAILMGSLSDEKPQKGSDIDILLVIDGEVEEQSNHIRKIIKDHYCDQILYMLNAEQKVIFYMKKPYVKWDLAYAVNMEEKSRYLRGSETCRVILDKTGKLEAQLTKIMETKAYECLPEYKAELHANHFLEYFEILCKSIIRKDQFRVEFYGFLLRIALVTLESISNDVTAHLYLPKNAFDEEESKVNKLEQLLLIDEDKLWQVAKEYCNLFCELCHSCHQRNDIDGLGLKNVKDDVEEYKKFLKTTMDYYHEGLCNE